MPDNQDYADLRELLSHPERWSHEEVEKARLLRRAQAAAAADYDQRDKRRVEAMWGLVSELDTALATWEASQ